MNVVDGNLHRAIRKRCWRLTREWSHQNYTWSESRCRYSVYSSETQGRQRGSGATLFLPSWLH